VSGRAAAFLDRDGTLIADPGYLRDPSRVALLPGAVDALRAFRKAGLALVVVTNQSGLARGTILPHEAAAVRARFEALLAEQGLALDATYTCPHGPEDGCPCRKPRPGMLLQAARELGLDLAASVMIGDKVADAEAGLAAGCRGVRFTGDWTTLLDSLHIGAAC
jgi:D-glycero-D-manno-heptose 1,7-bisphosphate phosphatase